MGGQDADTQIPNRRARPCTSPVKVCLAMPSMGVVGTAGVKGALQSHCDAFTDLPQQASPWPYLFRYRR